MHSRPKTKKTPNAEEEEENAERPTPNAKYRTRKRAHECLPTHRLDLLQFDIGRWTFGVRRFLNSPAFPLAQAKTRRLVCRTLCDHFFAKPGSCSQPAP